MKRKGFTLAEVIIALGIVGLVAAISAPLINGIFPDKNKLMVLKTYKTISDITFEMLNDPSLYRKDICNFPNINAPVTCVGLGYVTQPEVIPYNNDQNYSGITKYPYIFASKLELEEQPENDNGEISFTTNDGLSWTIFDVAAGEINNTGLYGIDYQIDVDINGDTGPNCSVCRNADQYSFLVNYKGNIIGADALTTRYLSNPDKLNDRKADYSAAGVE